MTTRLRSRRRVQRSRLAALALVKSTGSADNAMVRNQSETSRRFDDSGESAEARVAQSDVLLADVLERTRLGARGGLFGGMAVALTFAVLFREASVAPAYWLWLAAISAHFCVRARLLLNPLPRDRRALQQWARQSLIGLVFAGTLWGLSALVFFPHVGDIGRYFLTATQYVIAVMSVAAFSWHPPSFKAFNTPLFALMGLPWLLHDDLHAWVMLALIIGTYFLLANYVTSNAKILVASLALRFEREALLAQLVLRTEEAVRANESKSRFLASASHDLRQPLHALALLSAHAVDLSQDKKLTPVLQQIQTSTRVLGELIHALLDISRLDAGVMVPVLQQFRLQDVLDSVIDEAAIVAEGRGLSLRVRPTALWTESDPVMLARIIRNLVMNAIHYTATGGVLVASRVRHGQLTIEVWDTGIGIAPADQQSVFEEFVQINNPSRESNHGVGLGLSIVAKLTSLLNHGIALRSRLGRGSVFSVTVPIANPARHTPPLAGAPSVAADAMRGVRVLLVEDDALVRNATHSLLLGWGCSCAIALDFPSALVSANAGTFEFDIIIADYRLGTATGVEVANAVRALAKRTIPVIVITGDIAISIDLSALNQPYAILGKPLAAISLRAALAQMLRLKPANHA